ncbi:MAG: tRNA (N6-isopentenyl adenosine(37)-C2)-methylthiotransferase MiaB [Desulforegulaceae bacterium]|nr:tRNA (N6-isopentenyl adenosine(37)-C2)-methylthiotransferase MiaB [Desulforegulaceae bacterium]
MKSVYVFTLGCQMNVYDSEQIIRLLHPLGYSSVDDPEKADLVILNTCSIRQKAFDKGFSFLGRIKKQKKNNFDVLIGVGGCVAQQEGEKILKRAPYVDFVFGTSAIHRLPEIVRRAENGEKISDTSEGGVIIETGSNPDLPDEITPSGFVSIMRGCNNFCTYCIVPFVRGREQSRDHTEILEEIKRRSLKGMKEITLLGQNVNSYGKKASMPDFPDLLYMVSEIDGIERIRFATSHPKDLSDKLVDCFKNIDKLCRHFHIPVQSGSDKILSDMNRKYSVEHYFQRIQALRKACPEIELSTDIIVGFPGETEKEFNETLNLLKEVQYDNVFAFAYSDRPGTKAALFENKVDDNIKKERLNNLLDIQNDITKHKNSAFMNKNVKILVERQEYGEEKNFILSGRTFGNRIVHVEEPAECFIGNKKLKGEIVDVTITKTLGHSLKGELLKN